MKRKTTHQAGATVLNKLQMARVSNIGIGGCSWDTDSDNDETLCTYLIHSVQSNGSNQ